MATSPNYSWPEPDNTDLVKNGALAIRTLGNAIDTTMATMVPKSIVDAKGDLIAGTAADTVSRLAIGSNNQVLTADSTAATGMKWATPSSGATAGLVHLNTTTGTGVTSISIGSDASPLFSTTYDNYKIVIVCDSDNIYGEVSFRLRANTTDLTGTNYNTQTLGGADTTVFASRATGATSARIMDSFTTDYTNTSEFLLTNPFNSRNKTFLSNSMSTRNTLGAIINYGYIDSASSYNGITFVSPYNINNATIYVYGLVK